MKMKKKKNNTTLFAFLSSFPPPNEAPQRVCELLKTYLYSFSRRNFVIAVPLSAIIFARYGDVYFEIYVLDVRPLINFPP